MPRMQLAGSVLGTHSVKGGIGRLMPKTQHHQSGALLVTGSHKCPVWVFHTQCEAGHTFFSCTLSFVPSLLTDPSSACGL